MVFKINDNFHFRCLEVSMQLFKYKDRSPKVHNSCFIADGVKLIGDVIVGENASIWFNCVVRGDVNTISIGDNTNIQDLSMLHVTEVGPLIIGKNVTIGHCVILHACKIGDGSLIGMGANILDGAVIGKKCLIAAGSVVPPGKVYPDESFIMGSPAKVIRSLLPAEIEGYSNHYKSYVKYAGEFKDDSIVSRIKD
jgi:carbonic anhydrase/acetyltransferase-like protein (isoleucine patch superfamily)